MTFYLFIRMAKIKINAVNMTCAILLCTTMHKITNAERYRLNILSVIEPINTKL